MLSRLQGASRVGHALFRAAPQAAAALSGSSHDEWDAPPSLGRVLSRSAAGQQRFAERKTRHWLPQPRHGAKPPGEDDEASWLPAPRYRGAACVEEHAASAVAAESDAPPLLAAAAVAPPAAPPVWTRAPRATTYAYAYCTSANPYEGLAAAMLSRDPDDGAESAALLARAAALPDSRLLNRLLKALGEEEAAAEGEPVPERERVPRRPPGGRTSAGFAQHAALLAARQPRRPTPAAAARARRGCRWGLAVFEALKEVPPRAGSSERLLNVHSCTTLIAQLGRHRQWTAARAVFDWLRGSGQAPNAFTYSALVFAYDKGEQYGAAVAVLADMDAAGVAPNAITLCALTVAAARGGAFAELKRLYERMAMLGIRPDTVTCNTVLAICARSEHRARAQMAMWSYECMAQAKMQPTTVTFNVLISACERGAEWKRALNCYDMLKAIPGLRPDSITFNSLISVCEKAGQWAAAEECFKRMREEDLVPTTVTYNALISACEKGAALDRALFWFSDMKRCGVPVDEITYNALISCCEKAGRWDTAVSIFDSMRGGPVKPTTITFSALIAALEKGGEWERALKMFEEMPAMGCLPNHITYNSLVSACAAGRQWGPALEVYHRMLHAGVVPDRATFNPLVAVLWSAGQFARAQELLREAIDDGVYGEPFAQAPAAASLDLHGMSAGVAQACVVLWLRHLRERYFTPSITAEPPPAQFQIVTGWGKHSRHYGVSEVKAAVSGALLSAGSPFRAHRSNSGMLMAELAELEPWIKSHDERTLQVAVAEEVTAAGRAAQKRERQGHTTDVARPSTFATL